MFAVATVCTAVGFVGVGFAGDFVVESGLGLTATNVGVFFRVYNG